MDEAKLVRDAQHGDVRAFNTLILAYQENMFNLACCLLDNDAQAERAVEQVVQETFRDLKNAGGGSFRCGLLARLVRACQRISTDTACRAEREAAGPASTVWTCLQNLPLDSRVLLALVDLEGLNYREAASVLNRPVAIIRASLAQARQELSQGLR